MSRPEQEYLTRDMLTDVGNELQTRLENDIASNKINAEDALNMIDQFKITDAAKTNLKTSITDAVRKAQGIDVLTERFAKSTPVPAYRQKLETIADIKKEAVAAKAVELKTKLNPQSTLVQREQAAVANQMAQQAIADRSYQNEIDAAKFEAADKQNRADLTAQEADLEASANNPMDAFSPEAPTVDLASIIKEAGKDTITPFNISDMQVAEESAMPQQPTNTFVAPKVTPVAATLEPVQQTIDEVKPTFQDPLEREAAKAQFDLLASSRDSLDVAKDTSVDLLKGAFLGLGETLYSLGDLGVKITSDAARLATGAELTTDVPESDIIPLGIKGREDLAYSLSSGLDKLGKETIGVSLRPQFGQVKEQADSELKSSQVLQSKALSQVAASERKASVAAELRQKLSANGEIGTMDKIAAETGSFKQALSDTWNNPIELQSVIGESLPVSLAPAAFVAGKITSLTAGMTAAEKANFLASAAGKAQIQKFATKAGIGGGAALEATSNANQVSEEISKMSDEDLKKSPVYTDLLDKGYTPEQARNALSNAAYTNAFTISFGVSAATMMPLKIGQLEGLGYGLLLGESGKKLLTSAKDIGITTLKETAQETAESVGGQLGQNAGLRATVDPTLDPTEGLGDAGAVGALAGGITGGGTATVANTNNIVKGSVDVASAFLNQASSEDKEQAAKNKAVLDTVNKDDLNSFVSADTHTAKEKLDALISKQGFEILDIKTVANTANQILDAEKEKVLALKEQYKNAPEEEKKKLAETINVATKQYNELATAFEDKIAPLAHDKLTTKEEVKAALHAQLNKDTVSSKAKNSYAELYRVLGSSAESMEPDAFETLKQEEPELAQFVQDIRDLNSVFENKNTSEVNDDLIQGNENIRSIGNLFSSVQQAANKGDNTWLKNSINRLELLAQRAERKLEETQGYKQTDKVKQLQANLTEELDLLNRSLNLAYKIRGDKKEIEPITDSFVAEDVELAPTKETVVEEAATVEQPVQKETEVVKPTVTKINKEDGKVINELIAAANEVERLEQKASKNESYNKNLENAKKDWIAKEQEVSKYLASKGYSESEIEEALDNPQAFLKSLISQEPTTQKDVVEEQSVAEEVKQEPEQVKEEYVEPTDDDAVKHQDVVKQTQRLQEEIRNTGTENSNKAANSNTVKEMFKHLKNKFKGKPYRELKAAVSDYIAGIKSFVENEETLTDASNYYKAGRLFAERSSLVKHSFNALMSYRRKQKKARLFKNKKKDVSALFKNPDLFEQIDAELKAGEDSYELLKGLSDKEISTVEAAVYHIKKMIVAIDDLIKIEYQSNGEVKQQSSTNSPILELTYQDANGNYVLDKATKIAIAVGTLQLIGQQNLAGESSITTVISSKAQVNRLIGAKSDSELSPEDYEYFKNRGQQLRFYSEEVGTSAYELLGFEVVNNVDYPDFKKRLQMNMGLVGMLALAQMELVTITEVSTTRMIQARNSDSALQSENRSKGFNDNTKTVIPNPSKIDDLRMLSDVINNGDSALVKVFGVNEEAISEWPTAEVPKVSNKIKRRLSVLPKALVEALRKHQEQPHEFSDLSNLWFKLPDYLKYAIAGIKDKADLENLHITERASLEAANEALVKEINLIDQFKSVASEVFYFTHFVVSNRRIHIKNKIDVQNSKIHRWLVVNQKWKTTVTNEAERNLFKYSVVAAFDGKTFKGKVDVMSNAELQVEFERIMQHPDVIAAVEAARDIKENGGTEEQHGAFFRGVALGSGNLHVAAAINALTNYSETEEFTHDLAIEIDGKTNGFAISLLQYAGGISDEELKQFLERTGISENNTNMSDYKGIDSYQLIASKWGHFLNNFMETTNEELEKKPNKREMKALFTDRTVAMLKNATVFSQAFNALVPAMVMNDAVTDFGRKIAKSPLMVWNYNSGFPAIAAKFTGEILEKVYGELAKLKYEYNLENTPKERKQEIVNRIAEINNSLSTMVNKRVKLDVRNADKFYLNNEELDAVKSTMGYAYGTALKRAMESSFGALDTKRKNVKYAMQRLFKRHDDVYKLITAHYKATKMNTGLRHISEEVHQEILQTYGLADLKAPYYLSNVELDKDGNYNTADWIESGEFSDVGTTNLDGNTLLDSKRQKNQTTGKRTDELLVRTDFRKPLSFINEAGESSKVGSMSLRMDLTENKEFSSFKAIGLSPVQTHNIDAATMMGVFGQPVFNIHDAIVVGGNDILDITKQLNKSFYDVNYNYSIEQSLWYMWDNEDRQLAKMYENLKAKGNELKDQSLLTLAEAIRDTATSYEYTVRDKTYVKEYLEEKNKFLEQADFNQTDKQYLMKRIPYWSQYSFNSGGFYNFEVLNEEFAVDAALDDLIEIGLEEDDAQDYGSDPNFGSFQQLSSQSIDTIGSAQNVLNSLHQQDFAPTDHQHFSYLQGLLGALGRILRPVELRLGDAQDGTVGRYKPKSNAIEMKLRTGVPSLLRGMSNAETYVHEMLHHIVEPLLDKKNVYTDRLRWLHEVASRHVKPEHLVELDAFGNKIANPTQAQLDAAQETWNYIFKNDKYVSQTVINPITGMAEHQVKNNGFQEFVAYAATNKQLRKVLEENEDLNKEFRRGRKLEFKPSSSKSGIFTKMSNWVTHFTEVLFDYLAKATDKFYRLDGGKADKAVLEALDGVINLHIKYLTAAASNTTVESKLNRAVKDFIYDAINSKVLTNVKNKTAGSPDASIKGITHNAISALQRFSHVASSNQLGDDIDQIYRLFDITEDNIIGATITEMQGANSKTAYAHSLKRVTNTFIDNMRITVRSNIKHFINDNLFSNGLTAANKVSVYYALIKADWKSLNYSVQDIAQFLRDAKHREKRINEIKAELKKEFPNNYNFYTKHALNLGLYIQTKTMNEVAGAKNARMIAELNNARGVNGKLLRPLEGDSDLAEKLIDELATLHSLSFVDTDYLNDAANLIDSNPESVAAVIKLHEKTHDLALKENFNDNPLLMEKGYVADVTDPKSSLVFVYDYEVPAMLAEGYEQLHDAPIPKDKLDPNGAKMYVMVSRVNTVNTLQGGAFSTTGERARGTNLIQVRNHNNKDNLIPDYQAYLDGVQDIETYHKKLENEILKQFTTMDTQDSDNFTAIPTYNDLGHLVSVRYEMPLANKKEALRLHDFFDEALAYTASNIKDKVNSKAINRITVKALFDDFVKYKNSKDDIKEYVFIGKTSGNPKYRDLWYMLPYDTREEIKTTFGGEGFYIRRRNVADIMGQREMRTAEILQGVDNIFNSQFTKALVRMARTSKFRKYEEIVMELMKIVRDTIVVKSGVVAFGNIMSNWILAIIKTGNIVKTTKNIINGFTYTNRYMYLKKEVEQIKLTLSTKSLTKDEQTELLAKMRNMQDEMKNNPIDFLVKNGVYQTVVEDIEPENEEFSYASDFEKYINKYTSKVPDVLTDAAKFMFMTHDTRMYKFLFKATQLGDFAARYALFEHNKEEGMNDVRNIQDIMDTYIDYDYATHPVLGYLNKMNFLLFTKYLFRIQKVLFNLAIEKPANMLMLLMSQNVLGDITDPTDSLFGLDAIMNRMSNFIESMLDSLGMTLTTAPLR